MHEWLLFISHLPGQQSTPRMRLWRRVRGLGAAMLRDGVYLLPRRDEFESALNDHRAEVDAAGGSAHLLVCNATDAAEERAFVERFDRTETYEAWHRDAADFVARLDTCEEPAARREEAQLRRALEEIVRIDFFAGRGQDAARVALTEVEKAVNARFSPDEPSARAGEVELRDRRDYRGRQWATRAQLWIDRVASAWLIRRAIDPEARFLWLVALTDCPEDAVGFDFDGAEFSHVGDRVTFEVLVCAFGLDDDPALVRLGALIRHLDVGGLPVAEAPGVLALLGAARERCPDDDDFLDAASTLLDDLHGAFSSTREDSS